MLNTQNNIYKYVYFLIYPLLYVLSGLFFIVLSIRHFLYDKKIFSSYHFDNLITISVGNLNFGGSGKTPLTNYLIELLKDRYKIAVLSRGYGRYTRGFRLVQIIDTYKDCGDEPLMYKLKHPETIVAVCENRVDGIKALLNIFPEIQIVILDDAFQHRKIKADLNILITEYTTPFFKDRLFPLGKLRDIKSRAKAADLLVISKTPENTTLLSQQKIVKQVEKYFDKEIYFSYIEYTNMYSINTHHKINPYKDLAQYSCILVTGIANPEPLSVFIKEYARHFYHLKFPDHHVFTEHDLDLIKTLYKEWQSKHTSIILVTTEKDAMRLNPFIRKYFNLPLYIAPIRLCFFNHLTTNFDEKLLNSIRKKNTTLF